MSHILIIGAGASGLMAGITLVKNGHAVTVVEANDRTGGRIHTWAQGFSRPVELGAEFIHGNLPITFSLLNEIKAQYFKLEGRHFTVRDGKIETGNLMDDEWQDFNQQLDKLKDDINLRSFLNQRFSGERYDELRERITRFAEGFDLADPNRVSTLALKKEWSENDEENQYHIIGGYGTIIDHLAGQLINLGGEIQTSTIVKRITWRQGEVKLVTTNGRVIEGEKVIITVSAGCIQKRALLFDPGIPDYESAFDELGFGSVIKFLFEFKENFWEKKLKDASFIFSDGKVPTWWTPRPDRIPLLTGWLGGPSVLQSDPSQEQLFEDGIESLQRIFGGTREDLISQLAQWKIVNWTRDPFTQGAYTYPTLKANQARLQLSEPVLDTLYFAGEALYNGTSMGTVEAAFENGREAALKIDATRS